jgi:1-phosphatidylinositol-4-phosphate 5-kinase
VNGQHSPNVILKDNDIKYKIRLPPETTLEFIKQIRKDVDFLYNMQLMDYSLLVGVHNTEYDLDAMRKRTRSRFTTMSQSSANSSVAPQNNNINDNNNNPDNRFPDVVEKKDKENKEFYFENDSVDDDNKGTSGGGGGAGPASLGQRSNDTESVDTVKYLNPNRIEAMRVVGPDAYFMGIIDFQQRWSFKKKFERFFKIHIHGADPKGLSAIEPETYKER